MVADHQRDLHRPLAGLEAAEHVEQTVRLLGDEDGDALDDIGEVQPPVHAERVGQLFEGSGDLLALEPEARDLPLDAHEEDVLLQVDMLVEVEDVAAVLQQEAGDRVDDAALVGARDQ